MKTSVVQSSWLLNDGIRMTGQYHCSVGQQVLRALRASGLQCHTLQELCSAIFIPPRFKRPYVDAPTFGTPYITGSTMMLAQPRANGVYLSKSLTPNQDQLRLQESSILVSCSGVIGRMVLVGKDLANSFGSPDILRIVVDENKSLPGYVYSFLSSPVGQALITMQTYGSVIDHVEAHHVFHLPVPEVNRELMDVVHESVVSAWSKRTQANELLEDAQKLLTGCLQIAPVISDEVNDGHGPKVYGLGSHELGLRLDAKHYDPPARKVVQLLEQHPNCTELGKVTTRIFHPFRMNMVLVDAKHGEPFLNGSDVTQFRFFGGKYMSSITDHYEDYLLQRGWTLVTRSGTIGNVGYVGDYFNGWTASEHISRVVPMEDLVLPGYLNAFLTSVYAQLQIGSLIYGSVVDQIRESQLATIKVVVPRFELQRPIHDRVENAYQLRNEANQLEDEAQQLLLDRLELTQVADMARVAEGANNG